MKNFNYKLLLATTAILSTTALMVNADEPVYQAYTNAGITVPVDVTIVAPLTYRVVDTLSFGNVANETGKTIIIDATNGVVGGTGISLGGAHRALISVDTNDGEISSSYSLVFPDNNHPISLKVHDNSIDEDVSCGTVSNFNQYHDANGLYIGGTFIRNDGDLNDWDMGADINPTCEGELTVTLVHN